MIPKRKENVIGWVAMTGCNRAGVDMYGGKGCKTVPTIQYNQGNTMVQATMTLNIPRRQICRRSCTCTPLPAATTRACSSSPA